MVHFLTVVLGSLAGHVFASNINQNRYTVSRFLSEDPDFLIPVPSLIRARAFNSEENQTFKRRRLEDTDPEILKMDLEISIKFVITVEVNRCGFTKSEKLSQYRKTLELIAKNDPAAFIADEQNFKNHFKSSYASFKLNGVNFYLFKFILMFGADALMDIYLPKLVIITEETHQIDSCMHFLLEHRPLEHVLKMFTRFNHFKYDKEALEIIRKNVHFFYPDLPFFKRFVVDLIGITCLSLFIPVYDARNDEEAFFLLPESIKQSGYFCFEGFKTAIKAAYEYPDLFLRLSMEDKFVFAKLALINDDSNALEIILTMSPDLFHYVELFAPSPQQDHERFINILSEAVIRRAFACTRFLIQIVPEYLTIDQPQIKNVLVSNISVDDLPMLILFHEEGFSYNFVAKSFNGIQMNLLQLAFLKNAAKTFNFYLNLAGPEVTKAMIRSMWPTNEEILEIIFDCDNFDQMKTAVELFGIDLNAKYRHGNYEGNAIIFSYKGRHFNPHYFKDFDKNAPVVEIDPITGERKVISGWFKPKLRSDF